MCVACQAIPFREWKCLNPLGRMFCVLKCYFDESFNQRNLCVAGWLATERIWAKVENQWGKRLEFENRRSARIGIPAISRYKAADLESLGGEFRQWGKERKIEFQCKLIDILARNQPVGFACGIWFGDMITTDPAANAEAIERRKWEWAAYRLCMMSCLKMVAETLARFEPTETVAIMYDRGPLSSAALSAFETIKNNPKIVNRNAIVTAAPVGWENCIALQPADLIAYEGSKLTERRPINKAEYRRSFQLMDKKKIRMRVNCIPKSALEEMVRRLDAADYPVTAH